MIEKSEIIVNGIIDVLAGMKYSIKNLEEIQDAQKKDKDLVMYELQDLVKFCKKLREENKNDKIEKEEIIERINSTLNDIFIYYNDKDRDNIRIAAIAELRKQFHEYRDSEIVAKGILQVREILKTFLEATTVLDERDYLKYRDRAIELNPAVRGFFDKLELPESTTEEASVISMDEQKRNLPA